ncbi:hypothetical protein ATN04_10915 [Corynebacterium pseudotuberculosis]|nr:hypothetical protein ATN04_10915 [Corynebacterium pseudotuberculosis]
MFVAPKRPVERSASQDGLLSSPQPVGTSTSGWLPVRDRYRDRLVLLALGAESVSLTLSDQPVVFLFTDLAFPS